MLFRSTSIMVMIQVVVRFWIITMMLVLFGLSTLKLR